MAAAVVVTLSGPPKLGGDGHGARRAASITTAAGSLGGGAGGAAGKGRRRQHEAGRRPGGAVSAAAQRRLAAALRRALKSAGPQSGVLVVDVRSGATLFSRHPKVRRPPASVEKLWTTVAALQRLGPDARLHTTVLGTGSRRGDVWHGNLYLRGGGDPTFSDATFDRVWYGGAGPTASELTAQLAAKGIRRVTGRLYADESLFDRRRGGLLTDQLADVPDFGGQLSALVYDHGATERHYNPATFAAHELALTLHGSGISVTASRHDARTPRHAKLLATVSSPPISTLTRLMDVPSDDLFAEMLAKQLGVLFGGAGTIAAGARVISRTVAYDYDLHPLILDGSGLSRNDRSSPLEVVDLLRRVWHTPVGRELVASLPTVGRQGTVQRIALHTPAVGRCTAKTGTLNYVTNIAGYCNARGHHQLAFAIFDDGPDNATALALEGRMVGAIAGY